MLVILLAIDIFHGNSLKDPFRVLLGGDLAIKQSHDMNPKVIFLKN